MSSCTTGAKSVKKKEFSCVIRKIECRYTSSDEKLKKAVLFDRENLEQILFVEENLQYDGSASEGILYGGISNQRDFEYYFITNYKGKEIEIDCLREVNLCLEEKHHQYAIDSVDINNRELKTEKRDITDGKLKLYYFNLFYRSVEYAKAAAKYVSEKVSEEEGILGTSNRYLRGAVGGVAGALAGSTMDFICALRFIHLPRIKKSDNEYVCYTSIAYRECPNKINVPLLIINNYPDIEFSLEIGFSSLSHEYYADNGKEDNVKNTPFDFKLSATYASKEESLKFENINEKELDEESQRGTLFYKSINLLANTFRGASKIAQDLKKTIESVCGGNNNSLAKDVGIVGNTYDKVGHVLRPSSGWLKGSLEIKPSLKGKWRYSVSDDLSILGKYIELKLEAECKGELTVDLIQVYVLFLQKTKKTTTAVTVTTSVASGGLAAIPSLLIKLLVDAVVSWLVKKFEDGVKFDLIFSGGVNLKSLSLEWDTCRDAIFEGDGLKLEINPEIKLVAALEYKTSMSLLLTVEGEINASAEAATSLSWEMSLDVKEGWLGVSHEVSINPFKIRLEYRMAGGFEIFGFSRETSRNRVKEWSSEEIKLYPERWEWLKLYDVPGKVGDFSADSGVSPC